MSSSNGCIGNLMENTGLSNILKATFGGVDEMFLGKTFPNKIGFLRMVAEEMLRPVLLDCVQPTFEDPMSYLEGLASKSRPAKLRLDGRVWLIFIILTFIKPSCEADWSLHIYKVDLMLPYFATVFLIKLTKLPSELLRKFLTKEHAMRHFNEIWNSIWSDMMIETTVMRYGQGPAGMF